MNDLVPHFVILVGAYLLGSVSWSYIFIRQILETDVRRLGSGNAGATNVMRVCGPWTGLVVLLLDILKGAGAVFVAWACGASAPMMSAAALAAILGHVFPVYHAFRGGKGVATATGAFIVLALLPALAAIAVFSAVVAATRYVSLGSIVAVVLYPALVAAEAWLDPAGAFPLGLVASATAAAWLIIYKHRDNLRRLRLGEEWKLGEIARSKNDTNREMTWETR